MQMMMMIEKLKKKEGTKTPIIWVVAVASTSETSVNFYKTT
jgi:hypothetical protein